VEADELSDSYECYGVSKVNKNGLVQVPADARTEIGLAPNSRVILFGDAKRGRLLVLPVPPGAEHLQFVAEHAASRKPQASSGRRRSGQG
jgi:bifunctional DNA-binding transcriptional regulator/antitoxin component of YhaV-PrlF toxin-antitoxin module